MSTRRSTIPSSFLISCALYAFVRPLRCGDAARRTEPAFDLFDGNFVLAHFRLRNAIVVEDFAVTFAVLVEPTNSPFASMPDRLRHGSYLPSARSTVSSKRVVAFAGFDPKGCGPNLAPERKTKMVRALNRIEQTAHNPPLRQRLPAA